MYVSLERSSVSSRPLDDIRPAKLSAFSCTARTLMKFSERKMKMFSIQINVQSFQARMTRQIDPRVRAVTGLHYIHYEMIICINHIEVNFQFRKKVSRTGHSDKKC